MSATASWVRIPRPPLAGARGGRRTHHAHRALALAWFPTCQDPREEPVPQARTAYLRHSDFSALLPVARPAGSIPAPIPFVDPYVGGSLATGHPLGAGGGALLVNALDQLARIDGEYALVTIPAALGLGAAVVVRRLR